MSDHASFQSLATRLIEKHGRNVQLVEKVQSGGVAWNPAHQEVKTTVKAVGITIRNDEFPDALIQKGDRGYLVDSAVPVTTEMKIIDDGEFEILDFIEIKPGDQSILFKVVARG